jgi:hypothetical protein
MYYKQKQLGHLTEKYSSCTAMIHQQKLGFRNEHLSRRNGTCGENASYTAPINSQQFETGTHKNKIPMI